MRAPVTFLRHPPTSTKSFTIATSLQIVDGRHMARMSNGGRSGSRTLSQPFLDLKTIDTERGERTRQAGARAWHEALKRDDNEG